MSNGVDTMYEHAETRNWPTGESAALHFVTVHKVESGKTTLWKALSNRDWDFGGLVNHAPPDCPEQLATADTSWIFDATGVV